MQPGCRGFSLPLPAERNQKDMKRFVYFALSAFFIAAGGTLRAQDIRGAVRDADDRPLAGASVYWAGTTVGASTDAEGAFLLHRV